MIYQKSHISKSLIAALMIALVSIINFNKVVYLHTHINDNGSIVVHAHPYQKSSDQSPLASHKHTLTELYNIDNVNLLFFSFQAITKIEKVQLKVYLFPIIEHIYSKTISSALTGRAPPVS
jgi:hypothetical protein